MDPDPSQQQARLHQAVLNLQQEESSPKARLFFKWANPGLFSVYFCSFLITISIQIEKSIDGVLGISLITLARYYLRSISFEIYLS